MNARETVLAALNAWETQDLAKTASLLADDFELTGPAPVPLNKAAYLTFQQVHNDAFAQWSFNPHDIQVHGNTVDCSIQIYATHTGTYDVSKLGIPIPPIPPTGKSNRWPPEVLHATVADGKITKLVIDTGPGGGVVGTLEWLGIQMPSQPR